jgi:lysophospholipase L1-like esterase
MLLVVGICAALAAALAGAALPRRLRSVRHTTHHSSRHPRRRGHVRYYLALGDSLAQGLQPLADGRSVETDQGYASDLYAYYRRQIPGLKLVDFGCPGDSTASMLTGVGNDAAAARFHCDRQHGSQLAAAEWFLHAHKGRVVLVTIDIGANDVDGCANSPLNVVACVAAGEQTITKNTPRILAGIKKAAGKGTAFAAMDLYDPILSYELLPSTSPMYPLGQGSLLLAESVNTIIEQSNAAGGFKTADVQDAFDTYDMTPTAWGGMTVPKNLAEVCMLTWACTTPPQGPNIHANQIGYEVIASAFETVLGTLG